MKPQYKRDLKSNYLVLSGNENTSLETYQIKMVKENSINGLLFIEIRMVDGIPQFYYEISSKQPLERMFEHREITYQQMKDILFQISNIVERMKEYLLDCNQLVITATYLYMNIETNEIGLVYYPDYSIDSKESFCELAEFFLERVDHQDEKAVMIAYQLFKSTRNENVTIQEILEFFKEEIVQKKEVEKNIGEIAEEKVHYEPKIEDYKNRDDKPTYTKNEYSVLLFLVLLVMAIILVCLYCVKKFDFKIAYHSYGISLGVTAMMAAVFGIQYYKSHKLSRLESNTDYDGVLKENEPMTVNVHRVKESIVNLEIENPKIETEETKKEEIEIIDFYSICNQNSSKGMVCDGDSHIEAGYEIIEESETNLVNIKKEYGNTGVLEEGNRNEQRILVGKIHGYEVEIKLYKFPFTVGKMEFCVDGVIEDFGISRMHARFLDKDGFIYLEDLNSTNGTFINGIPLETNEVMPLKIEDEICFAKTKFTYY